MSEWSGQQMSAVSPAACHRASECVERAMIDSKIGLAPRPAVHVACGMHSCDSSRRVLLSREVFPRPRNCIVVAQCCECTRDSAKLPS